MIQELNKILITQKQQQFNAAMYKYENMHSYKLVGQVVSFVNVAFQAVLAVLVFQQSIGLLSQLFTFVISYLFADFFNGLVHMYMDNNDNYESPAGPLIASFHLHHKTPRYKQKSLIEVYYYESGSKIWLAFFLIFAVAGVWYGTITGVVAYGALYFSVLSSIAEISHYLCHIPKNGTFRLLGKARILMPITYHNRHHVEDNVNYAFLNGITDPLLNIIARAKYKGYKNNSDKHYAMYNGTGTSNRE